MCVSVAVYAQRWEKVVLPTPYDAGEYLDIFFLQNDQQYGWACDRTKGYVVRTTNGGATWTGTSVTGATVSNTHLEYIQFLSRNVGYCSGPGGVFKSTDGGGTWNRLNVPPISDTAGTWGGWFRNETVGWFVATGCARPARIYRTDDGGATFTSWVDSTIRIGSNFSDPYKPEAIGGDSLFAVGDGALWLSTNDGVSFAKLAVIETRKPWIEELAILGSSVLVPFSRGDCAGNIFNSGGMAFSTDLGQTWQKTTLGTNMFGAHLLSPTRGWVSGAGPTVQYTSNAGSTWETRTCGMDAGKDMDDIFFLNDSTGWVGGAGGMYRYARPLRKASDSLLVFTGVCPDSTAKDTVFFENINFNGSPVSYTITGPDAAQFSILNGPLPNVINSCAKHTVIIGYKATLPGVRTAQLVATFSNPDTTIFVALRGDRRALTAKPAESVITINTKVGSPGFSRTLVWQATQLPFEQIIDIVRDSGDTTITMTAQLPLNITAAPTLTYIHANPIDTGFTQAKFRVRFWPCIHDTVIIVKVYATSPIITAKNTFDVDTRCKEKDTLRIPIKNTGNNVLEIRATRLQGAAAGAYTILGYTSGTTTLPNSINPNASDTLLVQYIAVNGDDVAQLIVDNNDYTTVRGNVFAYTINLRARTERPLIVVSDTVVDVGVLCIGDRAEREVRIFNSGIRTASITPSLISKRITGVSTNAFAVVSGQTRPIRIVVQSDSAGTFEDTLYLNITPCAVQRKVLVRYTVGNLKIVAQPQSVVRTIPLGKTINERVVVRIANTQQATITDITLDTPQAGLTMAVVGTLPRVVQLTDSVEINLTYTPATSTLYRGNIIINGTGICNARTIVPLDFLSTSADITVNKTSISLKQRCTLDTLYDTVEVWSRTQSVPTLDVPIIVGTQEITVVEPTAAVTVSTDSTAPTRVVLRYVPTQLGTQQARLRMTIQPNGGTTELPINTEYSVSKWQLLESVVDFGRKSGCDADTTSNITFTNTGNVPINLQQLLPFSNWIRLSWETTNLAPNASTVLAITCMPQDIPTGSAQQALRFTDDVCGDTMSMLVTASRVDGQLTIAPEFIDVGTITTGEIRDTFVLITNATTIPRTINSLAISPQQYWQFTTNLQGTVVEPNSVLRATIRYSPTSRGNHPATVTLVDVERCTTSSNMDVVGVAVDPVEPPTYRVAFEVDEYRALPEQLLTIPVHYTSNIDTDVLDSVVITLRMPEFLQELVDVQPSGARNISVRWTYTKPLLVVGMLGIRDDAQALSASGDLVDIRVRTKVAIPDSAPISFVNTQIFSDSKVAVTTNDGSLFVDMCGPRLGIVFLSNTSIIIPNPVESGKPLTIIASATLSDKILCTLYSLEGKVVASKYVALSAGTTTIDILEVPTAGAYILNMQSDAGNTASQLLLVR